MTLPSVGHKIAERDPDGSVIFLKNNGTMVHGAALDASLKLPEYPFFSLVAIFYDHDDLDYIKYLYHIWSQCVPLECLYRQTEGQMELEDNIKNQFYTSTAHAGCNII